jgi:hypothetical protein
MKKLDCKRCGGIKTRACSGYDCDYTGFNIKGTVINTVDQYYFYSCDSCGEKTVVKFDSNYNIIQESADV